MIESRKFISRDKPVAPKYHNNKSLIIILRDLIFKIVNICINYKYGSNPYFI